jgi:hypothetical protein
MTDDAARREAVKAVYNRLPRFFQTSAVRSRMTQSVARCSGDYEEAALKTAIIVLETFNKRLATHRLRIY